MTPEEREELRAKIEGFRASLRGGVSHVSAPSLFPTPDAVADRLVGYARPEPGLLWLEPSAGTGSLVKAVRRADPGAHVQSFELDHGLARNHGHAQADFLDLEVGLLFDRVVMNPPFCKGADIKHVRRALEHLAPGGVLVAIVADGPRQAAAFANFERLEALPAGTFAGTQVRAVVVRLEVS